MNKIKKGDSVIVIAGKDKGKKGEVVRLLDNDKCIVSAINIAKKHTKPNPNAGVEGGIIDKTMPIDISNVMIWNAESERPDKVGIKTEKDGKKVRIFKKTGKTIDI
jgi:large subunit ribosomal protein L24